MKAFQSLFYVTLVFTAIQAAEAARPVCPQKLTDVVKCIGNKCEAARGWELTAHSPLHPQQLNRYSLKEENTETFGNPTCHYKLPSGQTVILMKNK